MYNSIKLDKESYVRLSHDERVNLAALLKTPRARHGSDAHTELHTRITVIVKRRARVIVLGRDARDARVGS